MIMYFYFDDPGKKISFVKFMKSNYNLLAHERIAQHANAVYISSLNMTRSNFLKATAIGFDDNVVTYLYYGYY